MLSSISDRELLSRTDHLRRVERETTAAILRHLNEIERRRLYLQLGYSSMFAYCTGHLRYSESAAGRRLQVARALLQFPEIGLFLERGEVSVVTVSQIASVLTKSTANDLLERIRGKTQEEVEAIASTLRPPVTLRDRVQHVTVPVAPQETNAKERVFVNPVANYSHCGSEKAPNAVVSKLYIQFLADEAFMEKYRQACALLSNRLPELSFDTVFSELLEEFIERHDPKARLARREQRAIRAASVSEKPSRRTGGQPPIPARTRDAVFARDNSRCTYIGAGGRRCSETRRLHVDHIIPVAHGGAHDVGNLRLLCAQHNQLEADRVLGKGIMDQYRHRDPAAPP